ncbi:hypothetical protein [Legionella worsleiensis]|uniref:Uncharacterized protein n=1 Tax=Legionella worsleiensis TaxID=45076 RepID=A0A0W1AFD3_9GAMM|nr:hypothetical protein [Legionella worsleiensis]KTD80054.1 hypothetical protein Lwor_1568 [Legionella worsleiensis]STY32527.1 Uncharacterised protein [Legionella worsleiensis]
MLHINARIHETSRYQDNGIVYRPDFIIYDMDLNQYRRFWDKIKKHPKNQLYTDGIHVRPVNWLQSLFQSFKGWLGFENHCQADKVELALAKIAYSGYLKNIHQEYPLHSNPPIISAQFEKLINSPRTNECSAQLQKMLMDYYANDFIKQPVGLTPYVAFGQTFNEQNLEYLLPTVDPQDEVVITKAIQSMNYKYRPDLAQRLKDSRFNSVYARHLVQRNEFQHALCWDEDIKYVFPEEYIIYFIYHKKVIGNALKWAIDLMVCIFVSSDREKQMELITYIKKNLTLAEQLHHMPPHSELTQNLAQSYLEDAKKEHNKYSLNKLIFGSQAIPLLTHATGLVPDILDKDHSLQNITLINLWRNHQLDQAIKDGNFGIAKVLFESHQDTVFDTNNLYALKQAYLLEYTKNQSLAQKELLQKNYPQVIQVAKRNIQLSKQIARITPEDNPLMTSVIDYVNWILKIDKKEHPEAKDAALATLEEAQNLLKKHRLMNNSPNCLHTVNQLLLRKIECLMEHIKVPSNFLSIRKEILPQITKPLEQLHINLDTFIKLNESNPTNEIKPVLGKIYYIKGDVLHFYNNDLKNALSFFKRAADIMPKNSYYRLRYFELTQDDRRHKVRDEIKQTSALYSGWLEERWNHKRFMSDNFDIHVPQTQATTQGILSRITGFFNG